MAAAPLLEMLDACTERCRNMAAPLTVRLRVMAEELAKADPEFAAVIDRLIQGLRDKGVGSDAPAVGDLMPDFLLPDQSGRLVSLEQLLSEGPVAIAFHRGHWCPYCRISAAALAGVSADIDSLGGKLVVITPEVGRFTSELGSDAQAKFPIVSDMDNGYALLLNLVFYVPDEPRRAKLALGIDLASYQGADNWTLPIPATFIVAQDGRITARFIDPDFRQRMDAEQIVTEIKRALS